MYLYREQWARFVEAAKGWTPAKYLPLLVHHEGHQLVAGYLLPYMRKKLQMYPDVMEISDDHIAFQPSLDTIAKRSDAFGKILESMREEGMFPNWRDEPYAARTSLDSDNIMFYYERGAGNHFGLTQSATHLNGYVREQASGHISGIWIAKRSSSRNKWPGRLETMVGGGLPASFSPLDNMAKETEEEAGLDPTWVKDHLQPTDSLPVVRDSNDGLKRNLMYIYDLELPHNMIPSNTDGEVESFTLHEPEEVFRKMVDASDLFKPDACLLLLSFFVRHQLLTPSNCEDFQDLQAALSGLQEKK